MYLKSIEVYGFKSFANKIHFRFHNGITAIVGPNGSGKSNVADAVRWVLGEQSAKSLRGSNMQDVIFSGAELRKPMGYASVSITLDNSDHQLPVSYDEVTVTRRVYRSGESEYLLNGTQVRLRDINELFYDTGIGKEGYSIIGQGQIEKILNGKPEERRELFDEAAGIVKFKRRKNTAQKKLEAERQNLVRVSDILAELTTQLEPLSRQAEKARVYLQKREELRRYDANLFLSEFERLRKELSETEEKQRIAESEFENTQEECEKAKEQYEIQETDIERLDEELQKKRDKISQEKLRRQQFENQIELLREQINTAHTSEEHIKNRIAAIVSQLEKFEAQEKQSEEEMNELQLQLAEIRKRETSGSAEYESVKSRILDLEQEIGQRKNDIIQLLNERATVQAQIQRFDAIAEQTQLRKTQTMTEAKELQQQKEEQDRERLQVQKEFEEITERIQQLTEQGETLSERLEIVQKELQKQNRQVEEEQVEYHREASRLESLKNIAERYDGYGNSIRRVMEQKNKTPGILGVVADIIKVDKTYEVAIETALGGSIQNIVTDTEETAKVQIEYLKRNKYGRATFLPLSGISQKGGFSTPQALKETGVIGVASSLVQTDEQYNELIQYLLGKTIVVDQIDHAIALQRKYRHSLRIVTTDGELLSPGGSMTGGAFRNSSNLLGRRREIEELEKQVNARKTVLDKLQKSIDEVRLKRNGMRDEIVRLRESMQNEYLAQNTAEMKRKELEEKYDSTDQGVQRLCAEADQLESRLRDIQSDKERYELQLLKSNETEKQIEIRIRRCQNQLEMQRQTELEKTADLEEIRLQLTRTIQQEAFLYQTLERISSEKQQFLEEKEQHLTEILEAAESISEKEEQIRRIKEDLLSSDSDQTRVLEEISMLSKEKDNKNALHKRFFSTREELNERMALLDRENFRLCTQLERFSEQKDRLVSYMWEEYGLTVGTARELKDETLGAAINLKRLVANIKGEIKALGNVNVNAIEDFKELSERHSFLSGQHDDLLRAEEALIKIINELDSGMRKQFQKEFACIQSEFDQSFRELFGGGHGTLELVEHEDILEAGIRIIAQPPGKKLQNMMMLSGGEKALTAIALLFAIQNLKPSPFCILDEIEAALDESNVDRYANYLHKLTKNTQFIIITHRRGSMNAADRMYGITMQEKGVSALVSVNLIEAELDT